MLVVLLAMLPLALTIVGELMFDRHEELAAAQNRAAELARLGAEQQDGLLQEARTVLAVLARVPQINAIEDGACHALLRQLVTDHPSLASIFVTDAVGQVTCNSIAVRPNLNVGSRRFVRELLAPGAQGYELSDLSISLSTGKPALFVGMALPKPPGDSQAAGVLCAGLSLDWLTSMAAKLTKNSPGATVSVLDTRNGAVLVQYPEAEKNRDWTPDLHPVLQALHRAPNASGTAEGPAPDGAMTLFGYAPLAGTDGRAVLTVGFPRQQIVQQADRRLYVALAVVAGAVLLAIFYTVIAVWRMLVRPANSMMKMADRLSAGNLNARVRLHPTAAPELRILAGTLNTMAAAIASAQTELAESELRFRELAGTDGLTGLPNRRVFDEVFAREWRRAARDLVPLSVLLLDVDRFKRFNDHYGHLEGDECLRTVAAAIAQGVRRASDLSARFGGEEFAILLPSTELPGAMELAESVRTCVAACGIEHAGNTEAGRIVTISIGVAVAWPVPDEETPPGMSLGRSMMEALARADAALYAAKADGRNCVRHAPPDPATAAHSKVKAMHR